jgi:hypothetical protein
LFAKDKNCRLLCSNVSDEQKSYITLATVINVIKLFFFVTDEVTNKFVPDKYFRASLIFAVLHSGRLQSCLQTFCPPEKMQRENALAYFAALSLTAGKSLISLTHALMLSNFFLHH